jgi:hypothetical protein
MVAVSVFGAAQGWNPLGKADRTSDRRPNAGYLDVIRRVANMAQDNQIAQMVQRHGLNMVNLTWEDTGRYKGSSVGPNISDMTIQVGANNARGQFEVSAMPVIRFPNFSDITGDIAPEDFTLMVGNQGRSRGLQRVSLRDVLEDPTAFMSRPDSWRGREKTLLAPRDSKVLVSAQACFLPIPQQGIASFNPVLFNYQSVAGDPAVLTILATREGTSMTIIDNKRDAFASGAAWGQRLFHNNHGQRTSLTGQRITDFANSGGDVQGGGAGLNMVLLIQVPLKQRNAYREAGGFGGGGAPGAAYDSVKAYKRGSDVEAAVIGHGWNEGLFTEVDNLSIQRDGRFPVRVTVQFYKATATGQPSDSDIRTIKKEIDSVYKFADNVGSLVTDGHTGRPTGYWGMKVQPHHWWQQFWRRHQQNTGDSPQESMRKLARLLGPKYEEMPVCELYVRDVLRNKR